MAEHDLVKAIGSVASKSEVKGTSATGAPGTIGAGAQPCGASQPAQAAPKGDGVLFSEEALEDLQSVQGVGAMPQFGSVNPVSQNQKPQPGMQVGGVLTTAGGFTSPAQPGMQSGGVYTSRDY